MKCSDAIIEKLKEHEVTTVFGYPGANIAPLYDSLSESGIKHMLCGNEQFVAMEASGYFYHTKKTGVCFVTSGPGAVNAVSGIANAWADSCPLVIFSGQVPSDKIGTDAFQEADITGAVAPFCKYSFLVKDAKSIKRTIDEAFLIAETGRCGPVLIDIPLDIQEEEAEYFEEGIDLPGYKYEFLPDEEKIIEASKMINSSKRPLILSGGGAEKTTELVSKLSQKGINIVTTMRGRGYIEDSPYNLGMAGIYGSKMANEAIKNTDCLIVLGSRLSERTILSHVENSIHIDIDKAELSKNIKSLGINADISYVLERLIPMIDEREPFFKKEEDNYEGNLFTDFASYVSRCFNGFMSADVGQNLILALKGIEKGKNVALSSGLGSMGYAIPSSIGASSEGGASFAFCGDGGLNMSISELSLIKAENLNVKIVVLDNESLGMIYELQKKSFGENYFATDLNGVAELKSLALAYGFGYFCLENKEDIKKAYDEAISHNGGFIIRIKLPLKDSDLEGVEL